MRNSAIFSVLPMKNLMAKVLLLFPAEEKTLRVFLAGLLSDNFVNCPRKASLSDIVHLEKKVISWSDLPIYVERHFMEKMTKKRASIFFLLYACK